MEMTDRRGQRIRRIMRRRNSPKLQQQPDHLLHLMLLSVPIPDDRLLDQPRRILKDLEPRSFRYQQDHAAHLPEFHTDLNVRREKRIFKHTRIRPILGNHLFEPVAHPQQPRRKLQTRRRAHRSKINQRVAAAIAFDNAPTHSLTAGIDPQNTHRAKVYYMDLCACFKTKYKTLSTKF